MEVITLVVHDVRNCKSALGVFPKVLQWALKWKGKRQGPYVAHFSLALTLFRKYQYLPCPGRVPDSFLTNMAPSQTPHIVLPWFLAAPSILEGSLLFAITHFSLATRTCFFPCSSQSVGQFSIYSTHFLEWSCLLKWASWTGIWTLFLFCPLFYWVQNKELPPPPSLSGSQPLTVQLICVIT